MKPPLTYENEQAVIASLIDYPGAIAEASQILNADDFSDPAMRTAWGWITGMHIAGKPGGIFHLHQA